MKVSIQYIWSWVLECVFITSFQVMLILLRPVGHSEYHGLRALIFNSGMILLPRAIWNLLETFSLSCLGQREGSTGIQQLKTKNITKHCTIPRTIYYDKGLFRPKGQYEAEKNLDLEGIQSSGTSSIITCSLNKCLFLIQLLSHV